MSQQFIQYPDGAFRCLDFESTPRQDNDRDFIGKFITVSFEGNLIIQTIDGSDKITFYEASPEFCAAHYDPDESMGILKVSFYTNRFKDEFLRIIIEGELPLIEAAYEDSLSLL